MSITKASLIDLNGQELILDADADTSITADTDDRIDIKVAGSDTIHITSTGLGVGTNNPQSLLHLSSTSPILSFTDTNSFSDANDRFIIRASGGDQGNIQWYDDSASATRTLMSFSLTEVNVNDDAADRDFRIESSSQANLFVVNAGDNDIGIGLANPTFASGNGMHFADNFKAGFGTGNGTRPDFQISGDNSGLAIACGTGADTADVLIDTAGQVGIGRTPNAPLDIMGSSSGNFSALRIRNSGTDANSQVKQIFSLNRTGSDVDFGAAEIVAGKKQNWTTTASTIDSFLSFRTVADETVSERLRIDNDGLKFNGDTAVANALHDYEEGTWTPSGSGTSFSQSMTGRYVKIGALVHFTMYSGNQTLSSSTGTATITGLPFTAEGYYTPVTFAHYNCFTDTDVNGYVQSGGTGIYIVNEGAVTVVSYTDGSGKYFMVSGCYATAS